LYDCPAYKKAGGKGGSYSYKWPIEKAKEIHNLALGLTDGLKAHMAQADMTIAPENYVMAYLGHWGKLSQSYKGE